MERRRQSSWVAYLSYPEALDRPLLCFKLSPSWNLPVRNKQNFCFCCYCFDAALLMLACFSTLAKRACRRISFNCFHSSLFVSPCPNYYILLLSPPTLYFWSLNSPANLFCYIFFGTAWSGSVFSGYWIHFPILPVQFFLAIQRRVF